jgi:hypothetical protein
MIPLAFLLLAQCSCWVEVDIPRGAEGNGGLPESLAREPGPPAATLGLRGWFAVPSGWLFITSGSEPGSATRMTVDDEFDPEPTVAPVLDAVIGVWGPHSVGVRATYLGLTGTGSDSSSFIFHGVTFDAGRRVKTDLSFLFLDVDYQLSLVRTEEVRLTGHLGAQIWNFSAELRTEDSLPPIDTKRAFGSAFWLLGVDGSYRLSELLELRLFFAGGFERSHQFFDELEALLVVHPMPAVGVTLGYRTQEIAFRQSTNRSDLRFSGPTLGAEISF